MSVVVNARFLAGPPTGLARTARALLSAALDVELDAEVVAPPGVTDPLVQRTAGLRGVPGRIWEQTTLPALAGRRVVLSLTNTAPLAARHSVVLVHDLAPLVGPEWFAPSMRAYGRLVLAAARRADTVLTVSSQVREELRVRGVTAPISLVRSAIDPGLVAPTASVTAAALAAFGITKPFVLLVGWPDPRKDVTTAIAAHLRALRETQHTLVLVGLPRSVFAPVTLPDLPSIKSLGYVDDDALRALLAAAAALLYPSRYEGFGLPPLEAWQCGTPALVSDLPSIREATEDRAVYLAPGDVSAWAEAITAALKGTLETPQLPGWTWSDAAGQLLGALDELSRG